MSSPAPPGALVLQPAHRYRRAPPALAGCRSPDADLLAYFYGIVQQRHAQCPAEYMLHFDHAHVYEGRLVLTPELTWLAPSITDFGAAGQILPKLQSLIAAGDATRQPAAGKANVVIAKAGSDNYGHTLVEILPKLVNIARSPLRDIRLLLPAGMAAFGNVVTLLLSCLGVQAELVIVPVGQLAAVENLHYFGPVSQHNTRKSATLLVLRDLIRHAFGISPVPRRKLFIDRREPDQRCLANRAEVCALAEARGYEIVHPVGLSFGEQVSLFSQASHIAGPLGAGLTNILLAHESCRVTMIDPGLADYFFWDLAAVAGQSFTWLFAGPVAHFSQELARNAYAVSLGGLTYALDELT